MLPILIDRMVLKLSNFGFHLLQLGLRIDAAINPQELVTEIRSSLAGQLILKRGPESDSRTIMTLSLFRKK